MCWEVMHNATVRHLVGYLIHGNWSDQIITKFSGHQWIFCLNISPLLYLIIPHNVHSTLIKGISFSVLKMLNSIILRCFCAGWGFLHIKPEERKQSVVLEFTNLVLMCHVCGKAACCINTKKKKDKCIKGDFLSIGHYNCDNIGLVMISTASKRH